MILKLTNSRVDSISIVEYLINEVNNMKENKSLRGRVNDNEPNPVDVHVGNRIRLRRTILHITQQQMAEMLGLTFQQIQKYEKGMNRVGASRLWDISRVLEVPMGFFFEDMDEDVVKNSPRMLGKDQNEKNYYFEEDRRTFDDDPMKRKETLELVRAYYKIPNRSIARNLFNLMVALSKSNSNLAMAEKDEANDGKF